MGKMRRQKRRLHQAAARPAAAAVDAGDGTGNAMETDAVKPAGGAEFPSSGPFKGVDIDVSKLASIRDEDFDTKSVVTSKSFKGMNMTKKEKNRMKKEFWNKKMNAIQATRQEERAKKKRKQTAVVGDMRPLEDTLPTLDLLLRDVAHHHGNRSRTEKTSKAIKKDKERQKDMMKNISVFKQVLEHPAFKSDPSGTISEHLQNKHQQEMDS